MWFVRHDLCLFFFVFFFCSKDASPKNASYYGNRAATLMMLSRFREALEDSQQAVRLDDCFMKVSWYRLSHLECQFSIPLCTPVLNRERLENMQFENKVVSLYHRDICAKASVTCL